jgi:hypothetical protein
VPPAPPALTNVIERFDVAHAPTAATAAADDGVTVERAAVTVCFGVGAVDVTVTGRA